PRSGATGKGEARWPPGHLEKPMTICPGTTKLISAMKQRDRDSQNVRAQRWARRLSKRVQEITAAHPEADPDNIRHTLILLQKRPLERLQISLIRGHATPIFRK